MTNGPTHHRSSPIASVARRPASGIRRSRVRRRRSRVRRRCHRRPAQGARQALTSTEGHGRHCRLAGTSETAIRRTRPQNITVDNDDPRPSHDPSESRPRPSHDPVEVTTHPSPDPVRVTTPVRITTPSESRPPSESRSPSVRVAHGLTGRSRWFRCPVVRDQYGAIRDHVRIAIRTLDVTTC